MLTHFSYLLNLALLISLFFLSPKDPNSNRYNKSLARALAALPLLACNYLYLYNNFSLPVFNSVLFSEIVFSILWANTTYHLHKTTSNKPINYIFFNTLIFLATLLLSAWFYAANFGLTEQKSVGVLIRFSSYNLVFFCNLFVLFAILFNMWRIEEFWRSLSTSQKQPYRFFIIGDITICCTLAWSSSYRITYLQFHQDHSLLLAMLSFIGWSLMVYAVITNRLMKRQIFISRKVIYTFIAPLTFGIYMLSLGVLSFIMRKFGLPLSLMLHWLLIAAGLIVIFSFIISEKFRAKVKYYVSTNFYVNKYEYRDEWLAFSRKLQGQHSTTSIISSLAEVLGNSLYAEKMMVWLKGHKNTFQLSFPFDTEEKGENLFPNDDINFLRFLQQNGHYYVYEKNSDPDKNITTEKLSKFLQRHGIVLLVPMALHDQLIGVIGLGPEFTGGQYGHDDFDLLKAIGTQAASSLLAASMAEEVAHARQIEAWKTLSTFILHDLKNASTMLSLLRQNAAVNIHKPDFQQDMLECIDDALRRMSKVQNRLKVLKGGAKPTWQQIDICQLITSCHQQLLKKLPLMRIELDCKCGDKKLFNTDPDLILSILENLTINAFEAGGVGTNVMITPRNGNNGSLLIEVFDDGPGIKEELLPDALFLPFKTSKPQGSGIGLWQVKQLANSLQGDISVENIKGYGAKFTVSLPVVKTVSPAPVE